jgi:membrane-associated phospholipid phosphatase
MTSLFIPHNFTSAITDMGDSALLAAVVLTGVVYLLVKHRAREAAALAASFIVTAGLIGVLKIVFMTCGHSLFEIRSPSGHTALSVAVFGTYALLMERNARGWMRFFLPMCLIILACVIGVTRVTLGFHSVNEVLVGTFAGMAVIMMINFFILKSSVATPMSRLNIVILIVLMTIAGSIAYGVKFPAEQMITELAARLKSQTHVCLD